jgi:predicted RND superfamily exporter protein
MSKSGWILIITLIGLIICLYYWAVNFSYDTEDSQLVSKIDSLTTKVDSIRRANDSIRVIIDTTEIQIEHVYEQYIQIHDHIVTQSVDSDCVFFSNYLSEDSKRFVDTINFEPVKTH